MAGRVLNKGRVIAYLPSFRSAIKHFRAFSSYRESDASSLPYGHKERKTVWPDKQLGPFGPQDSRFPLPGSVGMKSDNDVSVQHIVSTPIHFVREDLSDYIPSTLSDRHQDISNQLLDYVDTVTAEEGFLPDNPIPTASDMLECVAFECPKLLAKDFQDLFPDTDITNTRLTVITISHKTKHDMSGWSLGVEEERENLLSTYIDGACELCAILENAGYWADFIDPSSGKPYLGSHTNSSFHETDERYRKFGFEIDDLGCCKVIRHHLWGSHAYVGCLFTKAPISHQVIQTMRKDYNELE